MIDWRKELDDAVLLAVEREQRRIRHRLHENLCQTLSGVSMQISFLSARFRDTKPIPTTHIRLLNEHLHEAIDEVRSILEDLRSPPVSGSGLVAALERLAARTHATIPCKYIGHKPICMSDSYAAGTLFRIAEEAVNNAVLHAKAKKITISLIDRGNIVSMRIRDDGIGFDSSGSNGGGEGLESMRRYARAIEATLRIQSRRGRGTTVSCLMPHPN
jgi:signal transduction histidine kinase